MPMRPLVLLFFILIPLLSPLAFAEDSYELVKVWIWEKEIQLQIDGFGTSYIINLIRIPKSPLIAEIVTYPESESSQVALNEVDLKALVLDAIKNTKDPHVQTFGDEDLFFGQEINVRKRLYENDLPKDQKFLKKLVNLMETEKFQSHSPCGDLLHR